MLSALRQARIKFKHDSQHFTAYCTTQKTKSQRDRNRRLTRLASHLQICAFGGDRNKTCTAVCRRSGTSVWGDKRVVSLDQSLTEIMFDGGWCSEAMHSKSQGDIDREATKVIEADATVSEAYAARRQ